MKDKEAFSLATSLTSILLSMVSGAMAVTRGGIIPRAMLEMNFLLVILLILAAAACMVGGFYQLFKDDKDDD
jgi:hypothetical protein